jgi:hypothetical protein
MELKSRLVFVDTNIYEGKNFQFLTHSLGGLKSLINDGEVRLLMTDVTKGEVISHIKKKAAAAVSELKSIKKSAMILRNLPTIPAHGIFSEVSSDEIAQSLISNFETFLDAPDVEFVSIDGVKPSYVFGRYFESLPPFAVGEKEKEFADAFVLKALDDLSAGRGHAIHVISNDKDMLKFAAEHPRLICTDSIDAFIDAVNKSVSIEPAAFAAQALEHLTPKIMEIFKECLSDMQDDFKVGGWDSTLDSVEFSEFELESANLIAVSDEFCTYDLQFGFVVETIEIEKDYDRSPFDQEDDSYPFVLENEVARTIDVNASMQMNFYYQDKLIDSLDLDWDELPKLKLSQPYNVSVKEMYLDEE